MRVLLICAGGLRDPGGVTRSMEYLIEASKALPDAPVFTILDPRGRGSLLFFPFYFVGAVFTLLWHGIRRNIDVVHINMAADGSTYRKLTLVMFCRVVRLPTILHLHGSRFADFFNGLPTPLQVCVRIGFNRAWRVVVLGDSLRTLLCDRVGVDPGKIEVLPNAVPVPAHVDVPQRQSHDGPVRLLFLGRLGTRKGVPDLLEALSRETVQALSWQATLAGDGEVEAYSARAAALGVAARIDFTGWVGERDVVRLLRTSDVLILPSYNEGLPMAILEAMAYGLAVVTTPVGAIDEVIIDGTNGLLVPAGNPDRLAEAVGRIINDTALRVLLASNARRYAEQHLDVSVYARKVIGMYRNAMRESAPTTSG
jgi:glycosyltransferase involved in cell wall biosynthesis